MEDLGDRIGREARALVLSTGFRTTFAAWSERFPALTLVGGLEFLLDLRRSPHHFREDVFAALVTLIREDSAEASLVLLELLRPGIAVRVSWLQDALEQDEAWQEMITEVLEAARRFDPELRGKGIARELLYKAWRRVGARSRRRASRRCAEIPLADYQEEPPEIWDEVLPSARLLISRAEQVGALLPDEAELIRRIYLEDLPLREAAPGEPYDRINQRRHRALCRLKAFATKDCPGAVTNPDDEWGL